MLCEVKVEPEEYDDSEYDFQQTEVEQVEVKVEIESLPDLKTESEVNLTLLFVNYMKSFKNAIFSFF